MTDVFARNLVHFVRYLRSRGLAVVPATAQDLAAAVEAVGLGDQDDVYQAFKAVVVVRPSDIPAYDEAFELFFGAGAGAGPDQRVVDEIAHHDRQAGLRSPVLKQLAGPQQESNIEAVEIVGGSSTERLGARDFGDLSHVEREEVRRLMSRMIWRPADAASRRWGPASSGPRPDLRRSLRRMTGPAGDLIPLSMEARRPRKRPLVIIADVSGSMERYTEMFLYFIHAAQGRLGRVEAFLFATRLTRVTREMRQRQADVAIDRVGRVVADWSGGTLIGDALRTFNWEWSRRVTRGGSIGLVISDGWDTGDPAVLEVEMARFARSVHRVVWLNPLAGRHGYSPETRGMRTVLPYVDDFLPASNILDLAEVVRLLESVPSSRRAVTMP